MNKIEKEMFEIIKELRDDFDIVAIKAEFEAEGSRTDELIQLNEVIFRANMDLFIKIGGCEAVRDIDQCILLGATGIMAPMIETAFAMSKFKSAAKKVYGSTVNDIEWIFNAETVTTRENFDSILDEAEGFINTVAIGRVDFSASMGLSRDQINSDTILQAATDLAQRTRAKGMTVNVGGGISFDAIPFLQRMDGLIDRFETRKIVFRYTNDEKRLKEGIFKAMQFESLYLQNKCSFYDRMANEDKARVSMLNARIEKACNELA